MAYPNIPSTAPRTMHKDRCRNIQIDGHEYSDKCDLKKRHHQKPEHATTTNINKRRGKIFHDQRSDTVYNGQFQTGVEMLLD